MADYKRKKVKRSLFRKKNPKHTEKQNPVSKKQKSHNKEVTFDAPKEEIKVIKGSKYRKQRQLKIFICAISFIVLFFLILSAVLPGGLYENTVNFFATIGQGTYPTSVSGSTILDVAENGSHYYVLSDTNITAYSSSGKIIIDELHGFSNPIISVAGTRALVFDQGGKSLYIYNLSGRIHQLDTEAEIINASISEDGQFAVSTHSNSHTSVVTVYDEDFEVIYTFNSAKEIVNNVLVNTDGDMLAVSTFDVISGQYISKVRIFEFDSAKELHTFDVGNSLVIKMGNTGDGISIITDEKYTYLDWSDFSTSSIGVDGEINSFKNNSEGVLLTVNRPNDRSDNTIFLISEDGEKVSNFKISDSITDIEYYDGRVYSLCNTTIKIYDKNGKILRSGACGFGTKNIVVTSSDSVAAITYLEITEIDIEEGE